MGTLSDYLENELLDHVLETGEYTVPTNLYIALSTADPLDTGAGISEPASNYARKLHNTWDAAASRTISNNGSITFVTATGSWGTITHYAIFDALTGGNMLAHGSLSVSKIIVSGNTAIIGDGAIDISFSAGATFDFLANEILDHVFGNGVWPTTYNTLDVHVGLSTTTPVDSGTITEPVGNNYSRVDFANWSAAASGSVSNSGDIAFPVPSGSWGSCTHAFLVNGAAGTEYMFYGAIIAQTPNTGDTVRIPVGTGLITLT